MATFKFKNGTNWIDMFDSIYPIGAIYISQTNKSPADLFGGTWSAITGGRALRANASWGESGSATITAEQMPAHNHRLNNNGGGENDNDWPNYSVVGGHIGGYRERVSGVYGSSNTGKGAVWWIWNNSWTDNPIKYMAYFLTTTTQTGGAHNTRHFPKTYIAGTEPLNAEKRAA